MQNGSKNRVFLRFRKKRSLFRPKKHRLKKPPKFSFFERGQSMAFVKKWRFLILRFYAKKIKKQCFVKVPKEKKPFQTIKTSAQKTTTIGIFSKGLVDGFCQKNGDLLIFSFHAKWIKKQCFFKVSKEKKPFQTKKTSAQKSTKFCIFSKPLVHGFCPKMDIF